MLKGETLGKRNDVLGLCDDSCREAPVTVFSIAIPRNDDVSTHGDLAVGALLHNTGYINAGNERRLAYNSGGAGEGKCVLVIER